MENDPLDVDPLDIDPDTMRQLGYRTVDWLVDRATRRRDEPVLVGTSPAEMAVRITGDAPLVGEDLGVILDQLAADVLPFRSRIDHPRYLAYVPGEATWPGAFGDLIASTYNIDAGNWMEFAGPSHLELTVLRWLADWIGYPATSSGVLVSGGSAANLTALACAREALAGAMGEDLVAYFSDQGHSSLARAARILGFRPRQVRVLPVDSEFRMRVDALTAAINADVAAGRRPLVVMAVAGTTNTGAVDLLPEIAEVCRRHGVWLHVDGAYGGFAAITQRGGDRLAGIELADSVTLDPHKWLYQPFECGALLVREGRHTGALLSLETAAVGCGPAELSAVEHRLGRLQHRRGEYTLAEAHLQAALAAAPDLEPAGRAGITADLSLAAHSRGDASRARLLARKASALAEEAGDPRARCQAHNLLGMLATAHGPRIGEPATKP